jgi:serine transporter
LPINAGLGGFWPLLILALLAFPMTFYAHRGLTRFVLSGREGSDITDVVEEHFGLKAGAVITLLYFLAIFPILLIYSVALTNTVGSFMLNQLHITPPPRAILSLVLILGPAGGGALRRASDRQGHEHDGLPVHRGACCFWRCS